MEREKLKEKQIKIWERIVEDIEKIPFEDRSSNHILAAASALNKLEKYDEALEILQTLENDNSKEYELKFSREMGIALNHLEKYEDAFEHFKKYFKEPQEDPKACYEFACVLGQSGMNSEALVYLKRALKIKNDDVDVISIYSEMAWNFTQIDKTEEALKYYKIIKEAGRNDFWLYTHLGICYLKYNEIELALECLLTAEEYALKDGIPAPTLLVQIAIILNSIGKFPESIAYLLRAQEDGYEEAMLYSNLGFNYAEIGEFNLAIENFNQALEMGVINPAIYAQLGFCYAFLKDYKNSLKYLLKARELDEDIEWIDYQIGIANKKTGHYKKALKYLKKFSNDREIREIANLEIADVYCEIGDRKNAFLYLEKACKFGKNSKHSYDFSRKYKIVTDKLVKIPELLS